MSYNVYDEASDQAAYDYWTHKPEKPVRKAEVPFRYVNLTKARKGNSEQQVIQRLLAEGVGLEVAGHVASAVTEAGNWLTPEDIGRALHEGA